MNEPDRTTSPPDTVADDRSAGQTGSADAEPVRDYRGTGIIWGGVLVLFLAIGLIIVAFQNSQDVEFDFLWIDTTAPLVLILAIAIAAAVVVDEIVGFLWRRRRRSRMRDREELKRLRSQHERTDPGTDRR